MNLSFINDFLKVNYLWYSFLKIMVTIQWRKNLATCLGYREGTGCKHRSRSTQKRENWEIWQLCYRCARKLHPEYYANKKDHGVRPMPGDQYNKTPFGIVELPAL